MRVLVTGASGFLGSALASLLSKSHDVHGTTRGAALPPGVTPLEVDLSRHFETSDWPQFDAIVHLAQSANYAKFPEAAAEVFAIGAGATQLLLAHAAACGAKRFVFASTGGIYKQSQQPLREEDAVSIGGALGHYFATKYAGELLAQAYGSQLETVSARVFFCYGPGQRLPMLVPRLAHRIRDGLTITLPGGTGPRMNPIFVEDAAEVFAKLVEDGGPAVVNVGGPRAVSLREICGALAEGLGQPASFEADATREPASLVADIGLMINDVMKPRTDPLDGARRTGAALARRDH